jgi:hypothetical protein
MSGRVTFRGQKGQGAVRIGNHGALSDGMTITIGGKVYEWDNNASVVAGHVAVTIGGNAAADATNLKNAINGDPPSPHSIEAAIDDVDTAVVNLTADAYGEAGNLALATTMSGANIISAAAMTGGEQAGNQVVARGAYVVTALDVAAGRVQIETNLTGPRFPQIEVLDGGVPKKLTGVWTVDGSVLRYTFDGTSGCVDPANADVIDWLAFE